ncbi:MAG: hypothetical protein HN392_12780 [Anaerolineae bacterium]|nr:hypothetical protein [Anaerolineae bacterium]MBT7075689.1 hypothetical protein [Anaerolineae bacterium]MBT7783046.1 hypothetical protein [Anaerolineae bacterium]
MQVYARAYNQTVADDFYAAMGRVEKRLEVVPVGEDEGDTMGDVNVQVLLDKLSQSLLGVEERLNIVGRLREVVVLKVSKDP